MGAYERRIEILEVLKVRRYDKIVNLAEEFGVTQRTIQQDIYVLSLKENIRIERGKYTGGVYYDGKYNIKKDGKLIEILEKVLESYQNKCVPELTDFDIELIKKRIG